VKKEKKEEEKKEENKIKLKQIEKKIILEMEKSEKE